MSAGNTSARYDTIVKLAAGGMATVWIGTVRGGLGFRQLVAIKKPHPHLLADAAYRRELVAEARLASLIRHANVVDVRDVEVDGESISLVMDYIEGASLGELIVAAAKRGTALAPRVAVRIALDALAGLHAAHELVDERGRPVSLVHRDVSPQNILVGVDGLSRVADFGVAKFTRKNNASESSEGSLKGKLAYMAPEYLRGETIDRRFDVFALGVVLWETLTGKRLFRGANEAETLRLVLDHVPESLVTAAPAAAALDGVVATALSRPVGERFQNAQAMAAALEATALAAGLCGGHTEVAAALKDLVGPMIEERRALVRAKQAHEPSVASLMGMDPGSAIPKTLADAPGARTANMPPTVVTVPTTTANMPPTQPLGTGTVSPLTNVPSTQPMTPRMEDAPARTLLSSDGAAIVTAPYAPVVPPAAGSGPALGANATLASAAPMADAPGAIHEPSFNEASAGTAHDAVPLPPRSRLMPVVAAILGVILVAGAIGFAATRTKPAAAEAATSASASGASSTSIASSASAPEASAAASMHPAPIATASTSASASASASAAHPTRRVVGKSGTGTGTGTTERAAAAAPLPGVTATPTSKKPPPNPYANDTP